MYSSKVYNKYYGADLKIQNTISHWKWTTTDGGFVNWKHIVDIAYLPHTNIFGTVDKVNYPKSFTLQFQGCKCEF